MHKCAAFAILLLSLLLGASFVTHAQTITTIAGTGVAGFSGDGGTALSANLFSPILVTVGANGNLFFSDNRNHRIRKIDAVTGVITTVAGSGPVGPGPGGFGGDGGPATSAILNFPNKVTFDPAGNIFFADNANHRIRRIDAVTGVITTVAGTGVAGYSGDGGSALNAQLFGPVSVLAMPNGDILITDQRNHRIRKIDVTTGFITTIAGSGPVGPGPGSFGGDGGPATSAQLFHPGDMVIDPQGNLLFTDMGNNRIRKVDALTGIITTIAGTGPSDASGGAFGGDGAPATRAQFFFPTALALDANGNLFVTDHYNNRVRMINTAGIITTVAGSGPTGVGIGSFGGDGGPATSALLHQPNGVAIDASGRLLITDQENQRIRMIVFNMPPVVAVNSLSVMGNEGQTASNSGTISDPDGDGVTLGASIGIITNHNDGTWSWTFTTSDGPAQGQTVIITADDGNGGMAQTSFALTVNNVAPSMNAVTVPINPINISSQPVSISAVFSDPAGANDEPYTCTIDFGDGSGPQAGTISGMTCSGNHIYAGAGVYIVTVTVTDKDNGSGSASATNFIVIYDPSAGYVTGGGWIDSPPGAYVVDPTLTGKANFGFVSKYQTGRSTPDGNTTFHFNTANFKFKSTSYEWLVIAGPKAQYKGEGIVNNSGNYGFLLFARDGQISGGTGVDKFRIKIWDKNNGDAVVYDNQMGDADDGDATDVIEGGSIEIHSSIAKATAVNREEEVAIVPADFALAQNYPNPFNPSTMFAFDLPKDSQVKLTIYSLTGQVVATVVNGVLNAGHYTFVWQTSAELPSGTYLYKLETPDFTCIRKLLFLK